MEHADFRLSGGEPNVVGSFGGADDLLEADPSAVREVCEIAEVRLDLITNGCGGVKSRPWRHLQGVPLLFTARRVEEGGAQALGATDRMGLLESTLDDAACIDIEVASIGGMVRLTGTLRERGIPWIASFHDFEKLPETGVLEDAALRALEAGAAAFKAAAFLHGPADLARLAEFQLADHGLPVATMGMGALATVSRLLCAQCGSVLNYGYLGKTATAPGQWDAASLKRAISQLPAYRS